jgi:ankyrin repeat protein
MEIEVLLELIGLIFTQKDEVGDFVENLAKKKFVINEEDLFIATKMRQFELVRFILRSGVKPTLESFQYAAEHEFFELCSLFVEFGSREILSTPELEAELITNLSNFHLEHFKNLINRGVDFTTDYNFAIRRAAEKGYLKIVQLLLKHGADPTVKDNEAIKFVSKRNLCEVVRLLLDNNSKYKVDPTAEDNYAIKNASERGHLETVRLLLDNGADPTAEDNYAIKWASRFCHLEVVRLLLYNNSKYKVDPTVDNNYPIRHASGPDRLAIIKLLEEYIAKL